MHQRTSSLENIGKSIWSTAVNYCKKNSAEIQFYCKYFLRAPEELLLKILDYSWLSVTEQV
jgi:hypothetical protein